MKVSFLFFHTFRYEAGKGRIPTLIRIYHEKKQTNSCFILFIIGTLLIAYWYTLKLAHKKTQKHNEKNRDREKLTLEQKCKLRRAQNKSTTQVLSNT